MNNRAHILLAIGLLVVLAVLGIVMHNQMAPRLDLPFDLNSTGLAAEFVTRPDEIINVLGFDRRYAPALLLQQYFDFPFILCYVALYIILGLALRTYEVPGARWLAWSAIAAAVLAGACDAGENITILKMIANPGAMTSQVRWFSLPKWGLAFLALTIDSLVFLFWPALTFWWRIGAAAAGVLLLFAGAAGLLFTLLVSVADIAWAAEWMRWGMVAMLVFLVAILARSRVRHSAVRPHR